MTLRLGSVQTNLKGGKYLPAEPTVCWNTTQWAEILYEPSAFSKGEPNERVSLCLELTDEMRTAVEGLEKQVSDKKLEGTTVQSCIKQTRSKAQCLKLKGEPEQGTILGRRWEQTPGVAGRASRAEGPGGRRGASALDHGPAMRTSDGSQGLEAARCHASSVSPVSSMKRRMTGC